MLAATRCSLRDLTNVDSGAPRAGTFGEEIYRERRALDPFMLRFCFLVRLLFGHGRWGPKAKFLLSGLGFILGGQVRRALPWCQSAPRQSEGLSEALRNLSSHS